MHSGQAWKEQGDLGVPEEHWGMAPLHHTTVALYHVGQNLVLDSDIFLLHVEVHSSSSVNIRHNKHTNYTLIDLSHTQILVTQVFVTHIC
jgi:hypothetical protein